MAFQLGKKVLIINDVDQARLLFYAKLASGARTLVETDTTAETVAQADMLRILGFCDLVGSEIIQAIGAKAVPYQKQISTITFTLPTVVIGQEINVNIVCESDDLRGEYASHMSDYKKPKVFTLVVKAGETATTLATRLAAQISAVIESGWHSPVIATSAAQTVTLTSTDAKVSVTATFSGSAVEAGNATGVFTVTTPAFSGRGLWDQLKSVRLETVNGAYVEDFKAKQVPIRGAKYSCYVIKKNVVRHDLQGTGGGLNSIPSGNFEFEIYINESLSSYIADITKWLNANVAKRTMYTATTAAGVLGGDPKTDAVTIDAVAPFDTPLV
jgi:hypothetical protein